MNQGWRVDHTCPQCGAPVTLEETNHFLDCPYCRVGFFLISKDAHRYYLPAPENVNEDKLIYVPYWRFKGVVFSCLSFRVANQILDATVIGIHNMVLPQSLGLRPQAMALKFLRPDTAGRFIEPDTSFDEAMGILEKRLKIVDKFGEGKKPFCSAFFGETVSLIFAPYLLDDDTVHDGILGTPIGPWAGDVGDNNKNADQVDWEVKFVPALCPHCGWDLKGHPDSVIMVCENCGTASDTGHGKLGRQEYQIIPAKENNSVYLPFWQMQFKSEGIDLNTFADLIRTANLPRAVLPEHEEQPLQIWAPAVKVHGQLYLRMARNATVAQLQVPEREKDEVRPPKSLLPVTLPVDEAAESALISIANLTTAKRNVYPLLPDVTMNLQSYRLVYLPFHEVGQELVNDEVQLSTNKMQLGLEAIGDRLI